MRPARNGKERVYLLRVEDAADAFGAEIDERGGIEEFGFEEAAIGDVIDHHIQELDLVGVGVPM